MKHSFFLFFILISGFILTCFQSIGQEIPSKEFDSTKNTQVNKLSIGAGVDVYYNYDFNDPISNDIPYYVSMNRHNEVNINLAYIDVKYENKRVKARFIPAIGTYMNANYADETGLMKIPVEANVGVRLTKKKELWLEAGVLSSPYTNESALSKDHLMYTRSFAPEFVPYYLSGAKLSYIANEKWKLIGYVLNGWQQIKDKNSAKSIGTQVEYKPNKKNLINWNTYVGDERSANNPLFRMRYFSDVFWSYNLQGKYSFITCAYFGVQQETVGQDVYGYKNWWQINFTSRYTFENRWAIAGRLEYFDDPKNVQITPITENNGFQCFGTALGLTIPIEENAFIRLEAKELFSTNQKMFQDHNGSPVRNSTIITANLTFWY